MVFHLFHFESHFFYFLSGSLLISLQRVDKLLMADTAGQMKVEHTVRNRGTISN